MTLGQLLAGSLGAGVLAGGVLGARHAIEPDHLAAVATLTAAEGRPGRTGIAWGAGHAAPIVLIGGLFLAGDVQLPTSVSTVAETVVGLVLVWLGMRTIWHRRPLGLSVWRALREASPEPGTGPQHGHDAADSHPHAEAERASLAVGVIHGLAGSGGVVILLAASAESGVMGLAFLGGFALTSVSTMGAIASVWGRTLGLDGRLRVLTGGASVALGLGILAQLGLAGL
jgi:hypothetical protein